MRAVLALPPALEDALKAALWVIAVAIVAYLAIFIGNRLIDRYLRLRERVSELTTPEIVAARKRAFTAATILRYAIRYSAFVIAVYALLLGLSIIYPRLITVLAGLSVVGVALAFGAQAILRDIIAGFFILFENQYGVGDVVSLRMANFEVFGVVEELSLRFTKLRDLNGNLHFLPNGGILAVDRYLHGYTTYRLDILLPVVDKETVVDAIDRIADLFAGHPLLLGPLKLERTVAGRGGLLVSTMVKAVPSGAQVMEKILEALSKELKKTLGLEEPPLSAYYEVNEEALELYGRTVPTTLV